MFLIRLLIIGETGVGKTSLLIRFNEGHYNPNSKTTIGVDYKAKELTVDGENVKLQIWDTAGQERFRAMTGAFYNKAQGVIITFDVGRYDSFLAIPNWIRDVREQAPPTCSIIICANKCDLDPELWEIKREEYLTFASKRDYMLIEASASTGQKVHDLFEDLTRSILSKSRNELAKLSEPEDNLKLFDMRNQPIKPKKKGCGCG